MPDRAITKLLLSSQNLAFIISFETLFERSKLRIRLQKDHYNHTEVLHRQVHSPELTVSPFLQVYPIPPILFREILMNTANESSAALLLMRFKEVAQDELTYAPLTKLSNKIYGSRPQLIQATTSILSRYSDDEESIEEEWLPSKARPRTVSVASLDTLDSPHRVTPLQKEVKVINLKLDSLVDSLPSIIKLPPPTKKMFVGSEVDGPVKAILRKKFSWKQFPELEDYLIQHREQYLQYSSMMNYTSDQKRYNNQLTQGLIDLAVKEGYVFDSFTFAMIRDRIRCYYKSFVQAVKKKKRKQKR